MELFYSIRMKRIFELLEALKNERIMLNPLFQEDSRQNERRLLIHLLNIYLLILLARSFSLDQIEQIIWKNIFLSKIYKTTIFSELKNKFRFPAEYNYQIIH